MAPTLAVLREVFFFPSNGERLYASCYAAPAPIRFGMVVVPSIGVEAAQSLDPAHSLASSAAAWGGAGLLFHPPGALDSTGEPADLTLDAFARAVRDAAGMLLTREPVDRLCLIGFRFGAAAAALAAVDLDPRLVILLAPTLDPAAAVGELRRDAGRAGLGRGGDADAFGHPVPSRLAESADAERVASAMAAIADRTVVARFAEPPHPRLTAGTEELIVPGSMSRFRMRWANHLVRAAEPALRRRLGVGP